MTLLAAAMARKKVQAELLAYAKAGEVISRVGTVKAATAGVRLDDLAAQFLPYAEEITALRSAVAGNKKAMRRFEKAEKREQDTHARVRTFVPLDPAQWRAEMTRVNPPRPVNGSRWPLTIPEAS